MKNIACKASIAITPAQLTEKGQGILILGYQPVVYVAQGVHAITVGGTCCPPAVLLIGNTMYRHGRGDIFM